MLSYRTPSSLKLRAIAKQNGATATFVKSDTSDQMLQDAILRALSSVPAGQKG